MPVVYWVGGLTIWQLYVVGFAVGTCTVFFDVAYQSYIPALVGREDVVEANSKLEISRAAANIAGPGMAGGLIALLTAPVAVLVDAVSYAISAVLLFGIRKQEEAPPRAERRSLRAELGEGLRYVFRNPYQRTMVAMTRALELLRPGRLLDPARLRRSRARPVRGARSGSRSRSAISARSRRRSPPSGSATGSASGGRSCSPRACSGRARC